MKESRQDRFRRVVEARVNKLIHMLCLIGNCANRSVYEYSDAQVEQVFDRLQKELDRAHDRFRSGGTKKKNRFFLREPEADAPIAAERNNNE